MKNKMLKKLGTRGLVFIGLLLFVGIACIFAFDVKAGFAALSIPFVFGMASGTITDGSNQVRTLKYAHTAALSSGDVIVVGGLVLIALNDTLADAENVFAYITKATMPKKAALAISIGDIIYWDATPGEITKTAADGTMCGYCIKAAAGADTTVDIFLFPDLTNISAANIADGAITSAKLADNILHYATVNLNNTNIKNLRATPIQLVAAQGANKAIELVSLVLKLDAGSEALTESADNMAMRYENGTGAIVSQAIEATGFIDQVADTLTSGLPKIDAIVAQASAANKALVLHNTGDGEYAGNASNDAAMVAYVVYRVHDVS